MKICHWVVITPGKCGLYETTHDLAKGLRELGHDARLVDPDKEKNKLHPTTDNDRGVPIADIDWAKTADVFVNHSGLGEHEKTTDQPIIHINHGRPKYSFDGELNGGTPVYSYQYNKSKDPRYKASVTFWPEHVPYHEVMWHPVPVHCISSPVDLDLWNPEGKKHDFGGKSGKFNIVITDAWREDINPFPAINLFALYQRQNPDAKLHVYDAPKNMRGLGALLKKIQDNGGLGEVLPRVNNLANVYRAADLTLTPHTIAVRTIRESMACGCPILSVTSQDPVNITRVLNTADRQQVRRYAENEYNRRTTAQEFDKILWHCLETKRQKSAGTAHR